MILPKQTQFRRMLRYLGWPLVIFLVWDIAIVIGYTLLNGDHADVFPTLPWPLLGAALVLFLGFRNTSAYARWWEARTLWGSMVNTSRSFGRGVLHFIDGDTPGRQLQRRLIGRQIAYVHALRCALRRQPPWEEIAPFLTAAERQRLEGQTNLPNAILNGSAALLAEAARRGLLGEMRHTALEARLVEMSNAQGGMERIKNTPLPRQYTFFPRFFAQVFCALLPIGLVDDLGFYTPLASGVVGFMILAMERIGADMQDPFENTANDVPLTAICRTIEIDLQQALGEQAAPPPLQPVGDVLW